MKKLLGFLLALFICLPTFSQVTSPGNYDIIATAYVTTTISQNVVFNSTMQAGGTFAFSVLAHNGGGRAGQSDTANVKIQFYNASGGLVTSVNSSYSGNLPIPNAVCGNPCADPAVPWTTVSTSITLTSAQAATVAYAKISMYGIDGSYWAGDYGPWYRAPTFTLNGGANMVYNPEFGPYNGITAQGWTSSPGFGACQGAWGGSNACIVNSSGTPGTNTTGLVANANGGGPSSTGGTTSGQAGGYNSTMTTSNANGAPPAPTVVSTTTTNTTSTIIVGSQQKTITTPVTTTTYSDGTHTTTNGTATTSVTSNSAFTGVHFGAAQVADTQWNVYACTQTATCQIYSTNPGVTYNTGSPTYIQSNQYITFIPNTASDHAAYPWRMILVNSDGTFTDLGSCAVLVQGTDSNGYIYLFVSNANYNGTVLSGNLGLSGQGMTFTGTQNPTTSQTETLAGNMSSTPLTAGQTGGTPISSAPTVVSTSTTNTVSTSSSTGSTTTTTDSTIFGGQTYTVTGTSTPTTTTTTTTPVTTTTYSDGSTTTSNGSSTTTSSTVINYTVTGPTNVPTSPYTVNNYNGVYITQVNAGSSNVVNADQSGHGNYENISLGGSNNTINAGQGYTYNTLGVPSESTTASNFNVLGLVLSGNSNSITNTQVGSSNSSIINITGNSNSSTVNQTGSSNQSYGLISGNNNTSSIIQSGNTNIAAINLYGNGNNASISQTGNNHGAVLNLTNAGGPNTVSVVQTGTGDAYSLQQTCTNPAGCSVSVIRNR